MQYSLISIDQIQLRFTSGRTISYNLYFLEKSRRLVYFHFLKPQTRGVLMKYKKSLSVIVFIKIV